MSLALVCVVFTQQDYVILTSYVNMSYSKVDDLGTVRERMSADLAVRDLASTLMCVPERRAVAMPGHGAVEQLDDRVHAFTRTVSACGSAALLRSARCRRICEQIPGHPAEPLNLHRLALLERPRVAQKVAC